MITIKKEFSYGILAIVAIVAIVALFNLSSQENLAGEAFGAKTIVKREHLTSRTIHDSPWGNWTLSYKAGYYYVLSVLLEGVLIDSDDWVGAFNDGILIGARQWNTSLCQSAVCDIPAMGYFTLDGNAYGTEGYALPGDTITFKIWDESTQQSFDATPDIDCLWPLWDSCHLEYLTAPDCNSDIDICGVCGGDGSSCCDACNVCDTHQVNDCTTCNCCATDTECVGTTQENYLYEEVSTPYCEEEGEINEFTCIECIQNSHCGRGGETNESDPHIIQPSIGPGVCTHDDESIASLCSVSSFSECPDLYEMLGCYWKVSDVGEGENWWGYEHTHEIDLGIEEILINLDHHHSYIGDESYNEFGELIPYTNVGYASYCVGNGGGSAEEGCYHRHQIKESDSRGGWECSNIGICLWISSGSSWDSPTVGNDGSVICSELNRQGYMSDEHMIASGEYSSRNLDKETMLGYHYWAEPLVDLMSINKKLTNKMIPIGSSWGKHMAYEMGTKDQDDDIGRLINEIAIPLNRGIGVYLIENDAEDLRMSKTDAMKFYYKYIADMPEDEEELKEYIKENLPKMFKEGKKNIRPKR